MTETCLARIFVAYPDGLIVLGCSADPGHPDTHTAYYGAKLHSWLTMETPPEVLPTHSEG